MKYSESIGQIATALAKAQAAIKRAIRDSNNPFYKSKYADLASVCDACFEQLTSNEIAVIQAPSAVGPNVTIETMLAHSSGEFFLDELTMEAADARPQTIGSAITYGRRYALAAMAGVAPEDDDGNAAQGNTDQEPARRGRPPLQKAGYSMGQGQPKIEPPLKPEPGTKRPDLSRVSVAVPERPPMGSTVEVLTLPDPETEATIEREKLLTHVSVLGQKLGLGPEDKRKHWATYCEGASPQKVDPAALKPLVDFLRLRCEQKGIKVELT